MATNALYAKARERFLNGSISWQNDTIVAALVNGNYTVDFVNHEYVTDLGSYISPYPQQNLLNGRTSTNGVADASDVIFYAGSFSAEGTESVSGVVLYKYTGTATTSPLIGFYGTLVSFPFVWDGNSNVRVVWSNGTDKIFSL